MQLLGKRRSSLAWAVSAVTACVLGFAPAASALCENVIGDPGPGYSGSLRGIFCQYDGGAPVSWTVPTAITEADFAARGADDAARGRGGSVRGTLPVTPGDTFYLEPGGSGNASVLSLNGVALLVASGGNGAVPSYVTPAASGVESQAPGAPIVPAVDGVTYVNDGEVSVTWGTITKEPTSCIVPQLKSMRPIEARRQLAKASCTVGAVKRHPARRSAWGRVTGQWPKAGVELPSGSSVDLRIGRKA